MANSDQTKPTRVFIAIKIAPGVAQALADLSVPLHGPEVRRVVAADIHLTLVPPWDETAISNTVAKLTRLVASHDSFELKFQRVCYGPDPTHPRLLWAECAVSGELAALRSALLATFERAEPRPFRPHVTLARIRQHGAAIARKQPIDRDLVLSQQVASVELMQSPPPGAAGYTLLASVPLGAVAPQRSGVDC